MDRQGRQDHRQHDPRSRASCATRRRVAASSSIFYILPNRDSAAARSARRRRLVRLRRHGDCSTPPRALLRRPVRGYQRTSLPIARDHRALDRDESGNPHCGIISARARWRSRRAVTEEARRRRARGGALGRSMRHMVGMGTRSRCRARRRSTSRPRERDGSSRPTRRWASGNTLRSDVSQTLTPIPARCSPNVTTPLKASTTAARRGVKPDRHGPRRRAAQSLRVHSVQHPRRRVGASGCRRLCRRRRLLLAENSG